MNLKIAHISDLAEMFFNIPDYQRGYRWETKQVYELLNDLLEFDSNRVNGQFYCLQPLVVIRNENIINHNSPVFDVIDGQQRLTTLFLIMNYLELEDTYHLRYERVSDNNSDMTYSNGELVYNKLSLLSNTDIENNPDYFYLTQAQKDINDWFEENKKTKPRVKRLIEDVILSTNYKNPDKIFYELETDTNASLQDVRFIWYDASNDQTTYKGSIDIFKRLNYGKTSLTAAELIKALLFQCDIYDNGSKPEMKQVAFRMSTEWDIMEKKLQNKFMWSMLKPKDYDKPSHIDIVLSYVAKHLVDNNNIVVRALKKDKYYDYLVFNKYIEKNGYSHETIQYLWTNIQDMFIMLNSWYEDLELYHLIALYFMLNGSQNILPCIDEMKFKYENNDRDDFINWLKHKKIGDKISLKGKKLKNSDESLTLENIYYGDYNSEIINILLVYNVTLSMRHKQDQQRFPFYFCKSNKYINSLEHIHPQHLHNEEIDFLTLCLWFMDKKEAISMTSEVKNNAILRQSISNLVSVLELTEQEIKQKDLLKDKEDKYEANKISYQKDLIEIDKFFDELAGISEKELHSLSNMALVDKDTNAALGNGLLNKKRNKLQKLSKEFEESNGKQGAITFIGTWKVFNKEYSTESNDQNKLSIAANLNYWAKLDRENYLKEITEIYNEYVK